MNDEITRLNNEIIRFKAALCDAELAMQSRWTLMEEEEPSFHTRYFVTYQNDGWIGTSHAFWTGKWWRFDTDIPDTLEVIAWMPEPHPYKPIK